MKKLFFAVAALFVASVSFAQGFGGGMGEFKPEDMAKRNVDRLKEQLKLTQAQSDSIYKIYLVQAQDMQKRFASMQQGGGQGQMQMPSEEEMQKQQQARQAQENKIKSFLTEEQKKQYDEMQAQRRQGGFGGPGMGGPGMGGQRPQGAPGMGGQRPQGQPQARPQGQPQNGPQQAAPAQQNGRQRNRR